MNPVLQTAQYSAAAYNAYKVTNAWVQLVVYIILAISIIGSLGAALYCVSKGGTLEWIWYFGIYVKVACKFGH